MKTTRDSDVRRLLVITYHFPPDGAIGGQRWAGLSKYLARLGWEVDVITAGPDGPEQAQPGVRVHVCHRRHTLNDVYKLAASHLRRPSGRKADQLPSAARNLRRVFSAFGPVAALRRIVSSSMNFPDNGRGWIGAAASKARSLLRERHFDIVISSGPPHSAHFAALLATVGRDTQFWMDMRDPWSATYQMRTSADWLVCGERFLLEALERILFSRADRVVVNTREFADALRLAEPELDVLCIPNGIDLEGMPPRDISAVEEGSVAHVGTLYAGRNLSSVCAAMRELLVDYPEAAATLRLNVAGPMPDAHQTQMEEDIAAVGLQSVVILHGMLPRAQALALLSRSHLALVLAQNQPMQIPAKLYECVGLGIPTLVIAEATSAAASEARRIGAMTLDGSDVAGIRALLEDVVARRIPTAVTSSAPISYHDLANQMDRVLREPAKRREALLIEELAGSAVRTQ